MQNLPVKAQLQETHTYVANLNISSLLEPDKKSGNQVHIRLEIPSNKKLGQTPEKIECRAVIGEETYSGAISTNELPKPGSCEQVVIDSVIEPKNSPENIITLSGEVIDEAEIGESGYASSSGGSYTNDLRLVLKIWVSNLHFKNPDDRSRELQDLLRTDSSNLVILGDSDKEDKLASEIMKLANHSGGQILIKIEKSKNINDLAKKLLLASLSCTPPALVGRPEDLYDISGDRYVRVIVNAHSTSRKTAANKNDSASLFLTNSDKGDLTQEETEHAIPLDFDSEQIKDEVGRALSFFVNDQIRDGVILINNIPDPLSFFNIQTGLSPYQQLERLVKSVQSNCQPKLKNIRLSITHINKDKTPNSTGVIRFDGTQSLVATYKSVGYRRDATFRELSDEELISLYIDNQKKPNWISSISSQNSLVKIEYAELNCKAKPPTIENANTSFPIYDVQTNSLVWKRPPAMIPSDSHDGYETSLVAPLSQLLFRRNGPKSPENAEEFLANQALEPANSQKPVLPETLVTGTLIVSIEDSLASVDELDLTAHYPNLSEPAPIQIESRKTRIRVKLKISLDELYESRYSASRVTLRIPDVELTPNTVDLVRQACEDSGFRITRLESKNVGSPQEERIIKGNRSYKYLDIRLSVGIKCDRTPLKRQVNYARRTDTKDTDRAMLTVDFGLRGTGQPAPTEIATLQKNLGMVIRERLGYQREE